jgi:hypothetical protein
MKLVMDLAAASPLHAGMDQDRRALIIRLSAEAGILMEDMSPIALAIGRNDVNIVDRLDELTTSAADIAALLAAARALLNQNG